jgi:hypothetical protein
MSALNLSDEDMEERTLLILRASGTSGHATSDALYRAAFRAQCKALERQGFAQIKHRNRENETVFITAKGLERSTGAS